MKTAGLALWTSRRPFRSPTRRPPGPRVASSAWCAARSLCHWSASRPASPRSGCRRSVLSPSSRLRSSCCCGCCTAIPTPIHLVRAPSHGRDHQVRRLVLRGSGPPFDPPDQSDEAAERLFLDRLDAAATAELSFPPPVDAGDEVTPAMRHLRDAPASEQRAACTSRAGCRTNSSWYSRAAVTQCGLRDALPGLHLVLSALVVVVGALVVAGVEIAPLLIVGVGTAGAAIAWSDVRRYRALSRSYAHTARHLTLLRSARAAPGHALTSGSCSSARSSAPSAPSTRSGARRAELTDLVLTERVSRHGQLPPT